MVIRSPFLDKRIPYSISSQVCLLFAKKSAEGKDMGTSCVPY